MLRSKENVSGLCGALSLLMAATHSFGDCPAVEIGAFNAPYQIEVNSPTNTRPCEVDISVVDDDNIEYALFVCAEGQRPLFGCHLETEFQTEAKFSIFVERTGLYTIYGWARPIGCPSEYTSSQQSIYFYESAAVTLPDAVSSVQLGDRWQVGLSWPSVRENTNIASYMITATPHRDVSAAPIVDIVTVDNPLEEPPEYTFWYDLADIERQDLRDLVLAMNRSISQGKRASDVTQLTIEIEAITIGGERLPYICNPTVLTLVDLLPSVSYSLQLDNVSRTVFAKVEGLNVPSNHNSPLSQFDALRMYYREFDVDDFNERDDPFLGMKVHVPDDAAPLPSGAVLDPVLVSAVDYVSGMAIEGIVAVQGPENLRPAQCWDGIDNDGNGQVDFDGGDAGCDYQFDEFEFNVEDPFEMGGRTLIVYNRNTADAAMIADFYRNVRMRGHNEGHICPVSLPPGQFGSAKHLVQAAKAIRECICENILGSASSECENVTGAELARRSPISHLVLIKGIPTRLIETGWPTDFEEPSFDYYLSYAVYNDEAIFDNGTNGSVYHGPYDGLLDDRVDYQPIDSQGSYARSINASKDRILAYGRVEAINTERTLDLISRIHAAERNGVSGNFLTQGFQETHTFLAQLSSTRDDDDGIYVCDSESYVHDPDVDWDHRNCRAGVTDRGLIPGEQQLGPEDADKIQSIPYAVNAGLYLGAVPPGADPGHDGFSGFPNMLNWRHDHPDDLTEPCQPLCRDIADPDASEQCRINSTDYFREINTQCVGASPTLMGWQLRSYPVQYYGFSPGGWSVDHWSGSVEKTMPSVVTGSPFGDHYLHFGALDAVAEPQCPNDNGDLVACPELIAVNLRHRLPINPPLTLAQDQPMTLRFQYRRGGGQGGTMQLIVKVQKLGTSGPDQFEFSHVFDMSMPVAEWTTTSVSFLVPASYSPVDRIMTRFTSTRDDDLRGYLDVDHVELFFSDDLHQQNLLNQDEASFELGQVGPTVPGDWAANAIDRLGAVAWWGSSSHFLTGGYAFAAPERFVGAFYSGRTLGESLMYLGRSAKSGIIYGDPTYRPSGAKLYLNDGIVPINNAGAPFTFSSDAESWSGRRIMINAFHGRYDFTFEGSAPYGRQRWLVSKCHGDNVEACNATNAWEAVDDSVSHGVGGVFARPLQIGGQPSGSLFDLVDQSQLDEEQSIILRLRVWIPHQEQDSGLEETHNNDLLNYAFLRYVLGPD